MKICISLSAGLFLVLFSMSCLAATVTVETHTANIRNLPPSRPGSFTVLEVPKYYPLSVQKSEGNYCKVSDFRSHEGWIKKSLVGPAPGVVVKVNSANVRKGPGEDYPIVFRALEGVAFKVLGEKGDWVEVQHESGKKGWIFKSLTWGG